MKDTNLKAGDEIVEFGEIYKIFKIKNGTAFYRPFFKTRSNTSTICSIPLESLLKTKIRRPLSKTKFKKLISNLSKMPIEALELDSNQAKEILQKNRVSSTVKVLKNFYLEKREKPLSFSKKNIFNKAKDILTYQLAYTDNISPEKAEEKITNSLKKLAQQ